jgi:hypothetical protein
MLSNFDIIMRPDFTSRMKAEGLSESEIEETIKHPDRWQRLKVTLPEEVRNSVPKEANILGRHTGTPEELDFPFAFFMKLIRSPVETIDYWLLVQCNLQEPKKKAAKEPERDSNQSSDSIARNPYAPADRLKLIVVTTWRLYVDEFGSLELLSPVDALRVFCEVFGIGFTLENERTSFVYARLVQSRPSDDTLFPAHQFVSKHLSTAQHTWKYSISKFANNPDGTATPVSDTQVSVSLLWVLLAYCIDLKRYYPYLIRHGERSPIATGSKNAS